MELEASGTTRTANRSGPSVPDELTIASPDPQYVKFGVILRYENTASKPNASPTNSLLSLQVAGSIFSLLDWNYASKDLQSDE